jgi:hypothetical protein
MPDAADTTSPGVESIWAKVTGPCYDTHQMRIILGVSPTELAALAQQRKLLALRTADGHNVYPMWQFAGTKILPGLAEVLGAVPLGAIDDWTLASFLVGKVPGELAGLGVIGWLAGGNDPAPAVELARETSEHWMR